MAAATWPLARAAGKQAANHAEARSRTVPAENREKMFSNFLALLPVQSSDGIGLEGIVAKHLADAPVFADAWRAQYQLGMEEVRSGRIPYTKLHVLHRRMLDLFLPRFGVTGLTEDVLHNLTLSWRRLDGWPDVAAGFPRLGKNFLLTPVAERQYHVDGGHRSAQMECVLTRSLEPMLLRIISQKTRVYQASAEAFDLKPSECMMVSAPAHDDDIAGAAKAGLRTAAIEPPDEFGPGSRPSTPKVPADIVAKDLNDLADKLGA